MLEGFLELTQPLTDQEKKLIPLFIAGFKNKVGKGQAVTNKEIISRLKEKDIRLSEVQIRKIINYIRNNQLVPGLVACSKGYYITNDPEEIKSYINSLSGRENEIRRVKESMEKYLRQLQPTI